MADELPAAGLTFVGEQADIVEGLPAPKGSP